MLAQLSAILWQLFSGFVNVQLSLILWLLFPEAAQAQLTSIRRQLFSGSCADAVPHHFGAIVSRGVASAAVMNSLALVPGGCADAALTNFLCVRNVNFGYISGHFGVGGAPPDHLWRTLADQSVFRFDFVGIQDAFCHALGCLGAPIFRLDVAWGPKGRQEVAKIWPSDARWV